MSTDAPTNDRQTSERERLHGVLSQLAEIEQLKAEIAALRAENGRLLRERASEDVRLADVIAERNKLRAENEALRTVTDEDVIRTSARTGVMPVDVRKALQSFIRSKESRRG